MGRLPFASVVYLTLTGELPSERQAMLFDAILASVVDHGPTPPSTAAATTVAITGAPLSASVAAGVLAISKYHGGAIEDAMTALHEAVNTSASDVVAAHKAGKQRISGFGHRLHGEDPRTVRLFELAGPGPYVQAARDIAAQLKLPINADGAIAAVLCDMKFPSAAANGLFMIARVPGLIAHALEERERHKPMRSVDVNDYEYDGPGERNLP